MAGNVFVAKLCLFYLRVFNMQLQITFFSLYGETHSQNIFLAKMKMLKTSKKKCVLTLSITSPSGRPAIFNKDSFIENSGVGVVKASDESVGVVDETSAEFLSSFDIEFSMSYVPTGLTKYC